MWAAEVVLGCPTVCSVWMIWRWRLDVSTVSLSMMPMVPMPAAARYWRAGEPSPPAPMLRTRAAVSRAWPWGPIPGRVKWRA